MQQPKFTRQRAKHCTAFGLIEVLISVVILSIGLLGLGSLQNRSIQSLQEGDNLTTASLIAKEMAQRMMSNPYATSLGRTGYLATDINNDIATAGDVPTWAANKMSADPDLSRCYGGYGESCYSAAGSFNDSNDHITALNRMQVMDEIETRLLAWNSLPQGEMKICFDSTAATTSWDCDNVANRVNARNENVYTIKVRWNNLYSNTAQMYALQFTASCTDNSSTYCGN